MQYKKNVKFFFPTECVFLHQILSKYKSMTPQAIFFDIDGTLVSFKTHSIPASAKEAINRLRDKGIKVIIATGRALCDIDNLEDLEFDGFITANGTCCYDDKGAVIAQHLLSRESLDKIAKYLEVNQYPCAFMTTKGNFINFADERVISLGQLVNVPTPPVKPFSELIEYEIFQVGVFVDLEGEAELLNLLPDCESSRWHPDFTDINVKNCNKATGMDCMLEYFGISRDFSMAFGDGGNDLSMLKHAATGIAMGNGNDEVKAVADYVTTSVDDDGIVNALKYYKVL